MIGELPRSLTVNGKGYAIRTDFRDILKILTAFSDPELSETEKLYVCLCIFYVDCLSIPQGDLNAALSAAAAFMDQSDEERTRAPRRSPRTMDWEQDEHLIFPAVNKVAGYEVRAVKYLHWWTFLGYYMEISEGVFSSILHLRAKKAKGKKLEKWEREFWTANKDLCVLHDKLTAEEKAERDRLNAILG